MLDEEVVDSFNVLHTDLGWCTELSDQRCIIILLKVRGSAYQYEPKNWEENKELKSHLSAFDSEDRGGLLWKQDKPIVILINTLKT